MSAAVLGSVLIALDSFVFDQRSLLLRFEPVSKTYVPGLTQIGHATGWEAHIAEAFHALALHAPDFRGLLAPSLALGATIFIYLMASWYLVAQSAASRQVSSVVVDRLTQDPASGTILKFVTVAMLVLMLAFVVPPVLGEPVVTLVLVPSTMLMISVLALLTYRHYCLTMFSPEAIGRRIGGDAQRSILHVATERRRGPSIEAHHQKLVSNDLDVWDGLLAYAAEKDAAKHSAIISEFVVEIAFYLDEKRKIPADSEWFPIRDRLVPLSSDTGQRETRHVFEKQGLGATHTRGRDNSWFETKALLVLGRAAGREARLVRTRDQVMLALGTLLQWTWTRQEMDTLAAVEAVWAQEQATYSVEEIDKWSGLIMNTLLQHLDGVMKQGFSVEVYVPMTEYPNTTKLSSSGLPGVVLQELRWAAACMDSERFVVGQTITPLDYLSSAVESRLRSEEREQIQRHSTWVLGQMASTIDRSAEAGQARAAVESYTATLVVVARAWALDAAIIVDSAMEIAGSRAETIGRLAVLTDYEPRRQMHQQARIITLVAILNGSNHARSLAGIALRVATAAYLAQEHQDSETAPGMPPYLETILVIGGLAFACAEIRNDHVLIDGIVEDLRTLGYSLSLLSSMADSFESPWSSIQGPAQGLTLEYHRFVSPLFDEIAALPRQMIRGEGEIGYGEFIVTDSHWLREQTLVFNSFGMNDAIVGFLHYLSGDVSDESEDHGSGDGE